jgi:sulfatase maturation enzyme AslB (radical SAM superfamily)
MQASDVKWIHVEASSRCNASCPGCSRNNNGYGTKTALVEKDLDIDLYTNFIKQFPSLEGIQFCGNLGDPIAHHDFLKLVEVSKPLCKKIQIHSNAGLKSPAWWTKLATLLSDIEHDVWFGIDGIGAVHQQYRQGTDFDRVVANATAFINAGGYATWQFIPFKHNEHQIRDCMRLSQQLKFKKFKVIRSFRSDLTMVRDWRTGEHLYNLEPSTVAQKIFFKPKKSQVEFDRCMHLSMPSIYLSSTGKVSACCYFVNHVSFDQANKLFDNVQINLANPDTLCLNNCGS